MAYLDDQHVVALKLACLCQRVRAHVDIPASHFPLHASVCHCGTCRHVTGLLCATLYQLPKKASSIKIDGDTRSYHTDSSRRIVFCAACGASICEVDEDTSDIRLYTGLLDADPETVEFTSQCCMKETRDGGLSKWLDLTNYGKTESCIHHRKHSEPRFRKESEQTKDIMASCHCGGVQFLITLPSEASIQTSAPYPDLIVPFHSGSSKNEQDVKWWLQRNGSRYLAGTCACRSCRLASGNEVQTWAFIPKANIRQMSGDPLDFKQGNLEQYCSSKSVYRNWCLTCGATVFWHSDERPDLVDVSAGLLIAKTGARAEELLEWATARVSFQEESHNKTLIARLGERLRDYGNERPVCPS